MAPPLLAQVTTGSHMNWNNKPVGRSGNLSTSAGKVHILLTKPCLWCYSSSSSSLEMPSAQFDFDSTHSKYIQLCMANRAPWMLPATLFS